MNCRKFERRLEDYLQGGLDFATRFGMERHAKQCILCARELADAQRLGQRARELERVKAPPDFESSVLREIAKRRSRGIVPFVRKFWIYGVEWPSWQKVALAALSVSILGIGVFYLSRWPVPGGAPSPALVADTPMIVLPKKGPAANSGSAAPEVSVPDRRADLLQGAGPAAVVEARRDPGANSASAAPALRRTGQAYELTATAGIPGRVPRTLVPDLETSEAEYVEHIVPGLDNRPVTIRLPKAIRVQYGQASEEYFIRNVSH
jgi:hypothetical protein